MASIRPTILALLGVLVMLISACAPAAPAAAPTAPAATPAAAAASPTAASTATTAAATATTAAATPTQPAATATAAKSAATPAAGQATATRSTSSGSATPTAGGGATTPTITSSLGTDLEKAFESIKQLKSYEAETTINAKTSDQGTDKTQKVNIKYVQNAEDQYKLTFSGTDEDGKEQGGTLIRLADKYYLNSPDQGDQWIQIPASDDTASMLGMFEMLKPDSFWLLIAQGVQNEKDFKPAVVGTESVNGVSTKHFRGKASQVTNPLQGDSGTLEEATLDFWVADQGGYPARASLTGTGTDANKNKATFDMTLNVTNVGKAETIQAPPADKIQQMPGS